MSNLTMTTISSSSHSIHTSLHVDKEEEQHQAAIRDFRKILNEYTVKAYCGRDYVLVTRLTTWLKSQCPLGDYTQADRLLAAAYRKRTVPGLPINKDDLCDLNEGCLVLFSLLLDLNRGDLIHMLHGSEKFDKKFPIDLTQLRPIFREMRIPDAERVAEDFDRLQWKYFPAILDGQKNRQYPQNRILPFTKRVPINEKGGTAQLFQIEVLEEFVGPKLRHKMKQFRYDVVGEDDDDRLGPRYHFALKTFEDGYRGVFSNEVAAFHALDNQNAMVKYLGDFGHKEICVEDEGNGKDVNLLIPHIITSDSEKPKVRATHNILLEYGESDLEEYFVDTLPPYLQGEIECFWEGLFAVARAVKTIHHLELSGTGHKQRWDGWHADIKPDNILIVQGKFKLADPGFVKFVKSTGGTPRELLPGGTESYGAPERHAGWTDTPSKVAQTIDTWSLGCVFSETATWVVLGHQGVRQYKRVRQAAIQKIMEERGKKASSKTRASRLSKGDYFHDGRDVLTAVKGWHDVLRKSMKPTDSITGPVLDLVDSKMLLADPGNRIDAEELCKSLARILSDCRELPRIHIQTEIEELLRQVDDEAQIPTRARESTTIAKSIANYPAVKPADGPKTIAQERRSKYLGPALQKTSHRSQVLRSILTSQATISEEPVPPIPRGATKLDDSQANEINQSTLELRPVESPETYISSDPGKSAGSGHYHSNSVPSMEMTPTRPQFPRRSKTTPTRQDVFQARREVEERDKGDYLGRRTDTLLSRHYGNRDIKFLVDNADTMDRFWYEAIYLLETLIRKARNQDPDGMDLFFTSGSIKVEGHESRMKIVERFKDDRFTKAMKDPKARPATGHHTNPLTKMSEILDSYLDEVRRQKVRGIPHKKMTLIVLTDGLWEGMNDKEGVRNLIIQVVKRLREVIGDVKLNERPLSIQFIQFGDNLDAEYRLWSLDNQLKYDGIPDIVDHERSGGDVNKMLLGSFVEEYDEKENDDELDSAGSPAPSTSSVEFFQPFASSSQASSYNPLPSSQAPRDSAMFAPSRSQTGNMTMGSMPPRPASQNYNQGVQYRRA